MRYSLRTLLIAVIVLPPFLAISFLAGSWYFRPRATFEPAQELITDMEGVVEPRPPEMFELSNGLLPSQQNLPSFQENVFESYLGTVPVPDKDLSDSSTDSVQSTKE